MRRVKLSDSDYARLLALRTGLRHFERWSEEQAQAAGLTPAQHQLLLAIRGHNDPRGPTIGEVADYLLLRHHSAVGLTDRADAAGLVSRQRDEGDHRVVRLRLTDRGAACLERLSALHLEELERLAPELSRLWEGLSPRRRAHGFREPRLDHQSHRTPEDLVGVARVYDPPGQLGYRVLVDRLWPRGLSRSEAALAEWAKDVAPSSDLRRWYGHGAERFPEFSLRYRAELERSPAREVIGRLQEIARHSGLVLLTATRDLDHSGAAVLRSMLVGKGDEFSP